MSFEVTPDDYADLRAQYIDVEEFYGEKPLRWVQIAVRNALTSAIARGIRTNLVCLGTGVGKTIAIACSLGHIDMKRALQITEDRPVRVIFIAHIHRLLTQAERTFANDSNVDLRLFTPFSPIEQTNFDWCDIVVIDEAHHEAMQSVQLQLSNMIHKPLVGLTATYERADGMVIKFENIIEPITREQAVQEGWLAETAIWSFIDTSGTNKLDIVKQIINQYHQVMGGTLVFMRTKKEMHAITMHLQDLGYNAIALDAQSPEIVDQILDDFSLGKINFIVNCKKIGEGVDVKNCQSVLLGATVGSYPQLNQIIGRTSRPDCDSQVFELINPLSGRNLDATVVVGCPKSHVLCAPQPDGSFTEQYFEYTASITLGREKVSIRR